LVILEYLPLKVGYLSVLSFLSFAISLYLSAQVRSDEDEPVIPREIEVTSDPSKEFAKPPKRTERPPAVSNLSRAFVQADRPSAALKKGHQDGARGRPDQEDELASETLWKLGMTSVMFNVYVSNFKAFVSRMVLVKLVKKLSTDDDWIKAMLTIESFECRDYIRRRIIDLAASPNLAGHYGSEGAKWQDKEWTSKLPSDNRIVMHILGLWLSYLMNGRQAAKVRPIFSEKFLFVKKDPSLESEEEIDPLILWTDNDYRKFIVYTRYKGSEKFCGFPGRDSMYGALTLFFWFVKEKRNFLLDGADLKAPPICMDRVFELTHFV
jgi:hypothetical protein